MESYCDFLCDDVLGELKKFCKGYSYYLNLFSDRVSRFACDSVEFSNNERLSSIKIYDDIEKINKVRFERSLKILQHKAKNGDLKTPVSIILFCFIASIIVSKNKNPEDMQELFNYSISECTLHTITFKK